LDDFNCDRFSWKISPQSVDHWIPPRITNVNDLDDSLPARAGQRSTENSHRFGRTNVMSKTVEWIALILVVVGAVNWGLVGLAQFDLVAALFGGQAAPLSRVVYGLVGLAGIGLIVLRSRREVGLQRLAPARS
jgi:uncharacterized membrane protein YuzA (DUF378 family)